MTSRSIPNLAVLAMLVASRFPDSALATAVVYSAVGCVLLDTVLKARAGYLRRVPHWTRESWLRYFTASAIPIGALLIFVGMQVAFEFRISLIGAAHSTTRAIWVGGELLFMLLGGVGLVSAVAWLHEGDPSQQFTRFQRRVHTTQTPGSAA